MHYVASEECHVSTAGPGYYVVPSGLITDRGMLCMNDMQPGDTLDILKANTKTHDRKTIIGLTFVKFREDHPEDAVFKRAE